MRKLRNYFAKTAAAALTAAMVLQGTALAAPLDELNDIMEKQEEMQPDSLMEETLGLSSMAEAMDDNGLQIQLKAGLNDQTAEMLGEEAEMLKGGYALLGLQVDPELHKWMVTLNLSSEESSLLDASLYGDEELLGLSLPQFYAGALALRAGNFKEQLMGSELATILGITEEDAAEIPSIDMKFYPDDDGDAGKLFSGIQDKIEEKGEEIENNAQVEKTETDGVVTYAVTFKTEDIMGIYEVIFDSYLSAFTNAGMITGADVSDAADAVDQMMEMMGSVLGDELTVNFEVKDELVEKISYELYMDSTKMEQLEETVYDAADPVGTAEDALGTAEDIVGIGEEAADTLEAAEAETDAVADLEEADTTDEAIILDGDPIDVTVDKGEDFTGYMSFELTYTDPAQPSKGFTGNVVVSDENHEEQGTIRMDYATEQQGTVETATFSMEVSEEGAVAFSGDVYTSSFDSATGDWNITLALPSDDGNVELALDSTFSEIEKGKGFVLTVDEISMTVDGETIGATAEVAVSADPGEIATPTESKAILEMTQGQLLDLVNEVSANAEAWAAQFAPETEAQSEAM